MSLKFYTQNIPDIKLSYPKNTKLKYLLLTEFKGRTVNYGPHFSPIDLWPKREARWPLIEGERQGSVIYSMDQGTKLVRYLLYIFLYFEMERAQTKV